MVTRRTFLGTLAGALLAAPLAAEAQHATKTHRISFLALTPGEDTSLMKALLEHLHELGYREGRNMTFEYRSAEGRPERLPQLATELVRARPDVLIAGFGALAAQAAKAATASIPIVFTTVGDPLGAGLVASLGRPGGNLTGLTDQAKDLGGKRLQLLREPTPGEQARHTRLEVLEARTAAQVQGRFEAATKARATGLLVFEDPLTYSIRRQIAELAAKFRLPTISGFRDFAEAGGLMSYGTDRRQMSRRAAEYVDKILKGAKPADLPVEQPAKFELVINLKTAKALGLTIPQSLLQRADEVIQQR